MESFVVNSTHDVVTNINAFSDPELKLVSEQAALSEYGQDTKKRERCNDLKFRSRKGVDCQLTCGSGPSSNNKNEQTDKHPPEFENSTPINNTEQVNKTKDYRQREEKEGVPPPVKQSPSSGAINEMIESYDEDKSIRNDSCPMKSRRTALNNDSDPEKDTCPLKGDDSNQKKYVSTSKNNGTTSHWSDICTLTTASETAESSQEGYLLLEQQLQDDYEDPHSSSSKFFLCSERDMNNHSHKTINTAKTTVSTNVGRNPPHAINITNAVKMMRVDSHQSLNRVQIVPDFTTRFPLPSTSSFDSSQDEYSSDESEYSNLYEPEMTSSNLIPTSSVPIKEFSSPTTKSSDDIPRKTINSFSAPVLYANTNPETLLSTILESLGYSNSAPKTENKNNHFFVPSLSLTNNFFLEPTSEQVAVYNEGHITSAIRSEDVTKLRELKNSGTVMQCSNKFGESVVHLACRRGSIDVVKFLLEEAGVSLRVRDDYGRTPMHDACWTREPAFALMRLLVGHDPDLLLVSDKHGRTPLGYVRREDWGYWCEFLMNLKNSLLPKEL